MKKVIILSLVLILLAGSVVPAMASDELSNGRGNGSSAGQGNHGGNGNQDKHQERDQDKNQDQLQHRDREWSSSRGGNHLHTRMRTPFYLQGTISAIDDTAKTLTVTLVHGNSRVKQYIGTDLMVTTTDTTLIYQINQNEQPHEDRVPITFEQLEVGQKVAIHGNLIETEYRARLITVYIRDPLEHSEAETP